MNHDLVEQFKDKLDNLNISDYHGLNSPGLTCYLNSILQVLFMTKDFREAVKRSCSKDSAAIDRHLGGLFSRLQKSVAETHDITKKLGITNVYEQRDAAEYFEKILCLTSPEAAKMFKGELNHTTTCNKCKDRNDSRSFFWILPLVVEDLYCQTYSVEKGLKAFFKEEKVCGDNKMYCNCCKKKRDAYLGCEMTQNPEILTLLLKRFSFDYKRMRYFKLQCEVDVPKTLQMGICKYDLYAVVNHFGNIRGGHYTAQIKSFDTQMWYNFNDDIVKMLKQPLFGFRESLRSRTAYLLLYRKVNRDPENTDEGDQEAPRAHSDVEAEGRQNEADRGETFVPHLQKQDEGCNTEKNFKHMNGDVFKRSHDDSALKNMPNISGELEKQQSRRLACVWPNNHRLLQTDFSADGDDDRQNLQTQKSKSAKLEKYGGRRSHEPHRRLLDKNPVEHMGHPTTRGSPEVKSKADNQDCRFEQHRESQKQRLKNSETVWETQNVTVAKKGKETMSVPGQRLTVTRNRVEPGNMFESEEKSHPVLSNGYSSSSVPSRKPHLQSQTQISEVIGFNSSSNVRKKLNSSNRDEEKKQLVAAADSCCTSTVRQREKPANPSRKRNPRSTGKGKQEPWR